MKVRTLWRVSVAVGTSTVAWSTLNVIAASAREADAKAVSHCSRLGLKRPHSITIEYVGPVIG